MSEMSLCLSYLSVSLFVLLFCPMPQHHPAEAVDFHSGDFLFKIRPPAVFLFCLAGVKLF